MIACFGDSITEGKPGVSWVKYTKTAEKFLNRGVGGDTLSGLSKRVKAFLASTSCQRFVLEVGTNDIMLPFLKTHSKEWEKEVIKIYLGARKPLERVDEFIAGYENLLELLAGKKIAVVNIPCIGEDLRNSCNAKVAEFNWALEKLCAAKGVPLVDFNAWQRKRILSGPSTEASGGGSGSDYFITVRPVDMVIDVLRTLTPGAAAKLSRARGLSVTVDGVHLNPEGARGIAALVDEAVGNW